MGIRRIRDGEEIVQRAHERLLTGSPDMSLKDNDLRGSFLKVAISRPSKAHRLLLENAT